MVKYLGVPLIKTILTHSNCMPLMEQMISKIKLWTSASLTYISCLKLKIVLFSIHVYRSIMFILPCFIFRRIKGIIIAFLYKGFSLTHSKAKVIWVSVCYHLKGGGLGIKRVKTWNMTAILKNV